MKCWIFLFFLGANSFLYGQLAPTSMKSITDFQRRSQLLGRYNSQYPFVIQPLIPLSDICRIPSIKKEVLGTEYSLNLLPFETRLEFNSHHPHIENNGSMLKTGGLQTIYSSGVYGKFWKIEYQIRPEILLNSNKDYAGFPSDHEELIWVEIYQWWNNIDTPEQFGHDLKFYFLPGQSFVKLNLSKVSIGYSTQNLWWGPGKNNSLTMTDNARGFHHMFFASNQPIYTPIGYIEWQAIIGKLEASGFAPPDSNRMSRSTALFHPKVNDWRYLTGWIFSYQPKWLDGLSLGAVVTKQQYFESVNERNDYFPFFSDLKGKPAFDHSRDIRDITRSYFLRWHSPNFEIYTEIGNTSDRRVKDHSGIEKGKTTGYILGMSNLIPLKTSHLEFNAEITQLARPVRFAKDHVDSWYIDDVVRHGYTHMGEIIGSGIGPGSNIQQFSLSWIRDFRKVGIQLERLAHNKDFYNHHFVPNGNFGNWWVDYGIGALGYWKVENLIIEWDAIWTYSLNYQFQNKRKPGERVFVTGNDVWNFHLGINLIYNLSFTRS